VAYYKNKKKKRLKVRNIFIALLALLLVVAFGVSIWAIANHFAVEDTMAPSSSSGSSSSEDSSSEPPIPEPTTARVMVTGDNLIHSRIYMLAQQKAGGTGYDFSYTYSQVAPIFDQADFGVMNQETPLVASKSPSNWPLFNTPTELGDHMVDIGVKVFNHANNHILDQGVSGALETIQFWKDKADQGVVLTGAYNGEEDLNTVKKHTVNGITFSYIGVTEYTNGNTKPADSELKLLNLADPNQTQAQIEAEIQKQIAAAKAESDVVCVFMHWQQECNTEITQGQEAFVNKLISWGADVIYGSGPHVLQPIRYVEKPDGGKALVAYSLGNFISTEQKATNMGGGILDITYEKEYENNTVSIKDVTFIPTITHYNSNYSDIRIIPFSEYSAELAQQHGVRKYQSQFSYEFIKEKFNTIIGEEFLKTTL
jgi:poly-gamma-glutamate capsule biosynthesis protein CapA/YwtB (metallophosphatase superfamily)